MRRRDFLKKISIGTGLTAIPTLAAATAASGKDMIDSTTKGVLDRLDKIEKSIDDMDATYKKTMKAVFLVAGLSVGMDVTMLL
jgi:hypothetical protein